MTRIEQSMSLLFLAVIRLVWNNSFDETSIVRYHSFGFLRTSCTIPRTYDFQVLGTWTRHEKNRVRQIVMWHGSSFSTQTNVQFVCSKANCHVACRLFVDSLQTLCRLKVTTTAALAQRACILLSELVSYSSLYLIRPKYHWVLYPAGLRCPQILQQSLSCQT